MAKKWVLQTIGSSWRGYKCSLKRHHFLKYNNDKKRMKHRPKRVPKKMFEALLKIWNDPNYEKMCKKNRANVLAGKAKNIMHTSGPRSFARVIDKWKKDRKTTKYPTIAKMFVETRKQKLAKRKPVDVRDKLINDLKGLDSQEDAKNLLSTIIGSGDKNCRLHFHGRGVSSTKLKQKAMMNELVKKHAEEVEAMEKNMKISDNKIGGK